MANAITKRKMSLCQIMGNDMTFLRLLYWSAWTAITKCHSLGALNDRNLSSHGSGCRKSQIKVPGDSLPVEDPLRGS